ncbi:hypothetical protein [Streptomyces sp. NBC_00893]|uniref:hypothetical protein n=1 Tax=Streptomyces sp. NBC_00893 TaxID=2975862 RepID=UPI00338FCD42
MVAAARVRRDPAAVVVAARPRRASGDGRAGCLGAVPGTRGGAGAGGRLRRDALRRRSAPPARRRSQCHHDRPRSEHRRGLQLEPGRADRDTILQARRWTSEGADSLTLQPVLTAVDVLVHLRADQRVPIVAYSTSGEWAVLQALGPAGTVEYLAGLKRPGADQILTFAAETAARYLEASRA